jgi:hypothetical protein
MKTTLSLCVVCLLAISCISRESAGVGAMGMVSEGVINDPSNKTLRFDLLQFGLEEFCREMQRRGVALKMRDGDPSIGRFFASSCQSQIIDQEGRQSLVVRYAGSGYGWTNVTQRVGFETQGLVEYAPDFQLNDGAMYIYFRPRNVDSATFATLLVESTVANAGMVLTGVQPDQIGRDIVSSQLRRGFTVIRLDDAGGMDFGMGIVPLGQRPFRPFQVGKSALATLENDRTEIHAGQQDYVSGLTVVDEGQALFLTATLDGSPAADVIVLPQSQADGMRGRYVRERGPSALSSAPFAAVIRSGTTLRQYVAVPPGTYALLFDNSASAGSSAPPTTALDDRAARIDYLVQVGDRP